MRIAVNTRLFLAGKLEGIGWFAHETLRRLVRNHPEHEFIFFFDRPWHPDFVFAENVTPVVLKPQARHPVLYYLWTEYAIPAALKKYKADLYFSPDHLGSLKTDVPVIVTLHDLAYLHYPAFIRKLDLWHYKRYTPLYAGKARRLIAVSEYTRSDIVDKLHLPAGKIDVVYNGAHSAYRPLGYEACENIRARYTAGEEYFLFTGAIHPRKNIINLLKAFVKFKRRQRSRIKLMIVGRMAWKVEEIEKVKRLMPFKDDVIWAGYMHVDALAEVTAAAYAMVYPSLFEGFGIPILEAMTCHVPVIVSDSSSMPEVAGEAGLLVNPRSPDDIAEKMMMVYKDEQLRNRLIEAAKIQKAKFSWERSAEALWESMMKAVEN